MPQSTQGRSYYKDHDFSSFLFVRCGHVWDTGGQGSGAGLRHCVETAQRRVGPIGDWAAMALREPRRAGSRSRRGRTAREQPRQPASTARSAQSTFGWVTWRRSTATSWRNTTSSASFAAGLLASSTGHRITWQNSRYSSRTAMCRSSRPGDSPANLQLSTHGRLVVSHVVV